MKKIQILPLAALKDNYIWTIISPINKKVIIVDPGEAAPVNDWLQKKGYQLTAMLITHHHWDHTDGIAALLSQWDIPVYGPASEVIPGKTHAVKQDSLIELTGFPTISVIAIPGHTLGHVAYLIENALFCGDTLFSAGCGRIFEGTPAAMYQSLQTLAALPEKTLVYCAHEYTLKNCQFAHRVEPENRAVIKRLQEAETLAQQGRPTLPSTIQLEKAINPFLRCHLSSIQENVAKEFNKDLKSELAVFTQLRKWKDEF